MGRSQGAQSPVSCASTIGSFEAPVACEPPAECERAEVDVPDVSIDLLEADIFAGTGGCNGAPSMGPPEAPVSLPSRPSKRSRSSNGGSVVGSARGDPSAPQLGWLVGYLERDGKVHFFATNIDIETAEDAAARLSITKAILRDLGLLSD